MRRNKQRLGTKKIPIVGVAGTFRKLQPPTVAEGFDRIFTVKLSEHNEFVVTENI
jgi:hypothetical protein